MTATYRPQDAAAADDKWAASNFVDDSAGGEQGLPDHEHEMMTSHDGGQAATTGPC